MSTKKQKKKRSSLLNKVKRYLWVVPHVVAPDKKKPDLYERMVWTLGALLIYLWASMTPLYGITKSKNNVDALYWYRPMLASQPGTLMELGISPIISSQLLLQLMAGSGLIKVDHNDNSQKSLFQTTQKFISILIAIGEGFAYVGSGVYGNWYNDIGIVNSVLIIIQMLCGTLLVMLLDELLKFGYGIGSGISLFIATNICQIIVWSAISPKKQETPSGIQYEGAIIALFHLLFIRKSRVQGLKEAFYRTNLPNLTNLMATVLMFIIVTYFQGLRIDLPVKTTKLRGTQGQTKYPIKLFYTSNIPIIFHNALTSNIYFLSQCITTRFGSNIITNLLGSWKTNNLNNNITNYIPIGGLVYYISPPHSLFEVLFDPIHTVIYILFVLITCGAFAQIWIYVSGTGPRDIAKQLRDQGLEIKGYRQNATHDVLSKYIPQAAILGGVCIGALTILADTLGALGTGSGILLAVTIIFEIFEVYVREAQESGIQFPMPKLGQ